MIALVMSDLHMKHKKLKLDQHLEQKPQLLILAGDMLLDGTLHELSILLRWLQSVPVEDKLFVAGDHDAVLAKDPYLTEKMLSEVGVTYLQDEMVRIGGLNFYGSPWTKPWDANANAFSGDLEKRTAKWAAIPDTVDVLVTHQPPWGSLDEVDGEHVGCVALSKRMLALKPAFHIFGHLHDAYGVKKTQRTTYINASICNRAMDPIHPPILVDL